MNSIEEYVNQFDGIKKEWIQEFTDYMKEKHPDMEGVIWFRMPAYKIDTAYIAFSVTKEYFAFHTNDAACFSMCKDALDKAAFGKRSVKIKYTDDGAKVVLYNTIEFFVYSHRPKQMEEENV